MLMAEMKVAKAAYVWARLEGSRPPPSNTIPPAAVIPLIALVMLIRGVCKAGATPHTLCYPATTARANILVMPRNAGSGHRHPSPIIEARPEAIPIAVLIVCALRSLTSKTLTTVSFFLVCVSTGRGVGLGYRRSLLWVMMEVLTMKSSRLRLNCPVLSQK